MNVGLDVRTLELVGVGDEVLQDLRELGWLPAIVGIGSRVTSAPVSSRPWLRFSSASVEGVVQVDAGGDLVAGADAGIRQQATDERLHALGALDGVGDVFVGLLIDDGALEPLLEQLHVGGDHAQWLLQVVRGHVCELLQLGVGAPQLGRLGP